MLAALRCGSGIAALVHELREDLAAFCVNNICELLQGGDVFLIGEHCAAVGIVAYGIPLHVGKYNKTDTALGAFFVEEDIALGGISVICIVDTYGSHNYAVFKDGTERYYKQADD